MVVKIAISGGHGPNTPGKRSPDGYREFQFNKPTADYLASFLSNYENVQILKVYDANRDVPLAERTKRAEDWGADLYMSIHYNAAGTGSWYSADGIETLVYSTSTGSSSGYPVAQIIHKELIAAAKRKDRGIKVRPDLWELRVTPFRAVLCECGFMTDKKERELMASPTYQKTVAEAIGRGIVSFYKLKKKSSSTPLPNPTPVAKPTTPGKLYRVQIGAFGNILNAEKLLKQIKAKGVSDAFIKSENGVHRVQAGAFGIYANAQKRVNELKALGFKDAWITS